MGPAQQSIVTKLDEIDARYSEIDALISDPAVAQDPTQFIALSKEQGKIRAMVTKYREYKKATTGIEEARQMLADDGADPDFRALAEEEIEQLTARQAQLFEEMQDTLVMADDMHIDAVIIEIRAGTGGEEAALFAKDLHGMYTRYADTKRWKVEQLDFSASDMGGFREVIFGIKGEGVWAELG